MSFRILPDDEIPYFCYDRPWTAGEIRRRLQAAQGRKWARLAAWIMREAAVRDVWQFLRPQEVFRHMEELKPQLGARRGFWEYILRVWHELGKL